MKSVPSRSRFSCIYSTSGCFNACLLTGSCHAFELALAGYGDDGPCRRHMRRPGAGRGACRRCGHGLPFAFAIRSDVLLRIGSEPRRRTLRRCRSGRGRSGRPSPGRRSNRRGPRLWPYRRPSSHRPDRAETEAIWPRPAVRSYLARSEPDSRGNRNRASVAEISIKAFRFPLWDVHAQSIPGPRSPDAFLLSSLSLSLSLLSQSHLSPLHLSTPNMAEVIIVGAGIAVSTPLASRVERATLIRRARRA